MAKAPLRYAAIALCLLPFAGCANGDPVGSVSDDSTDDASVDDATVESSPGDDGGPPADAGCPDGHIGPGCASCASGLHACGASCMPVQPNVPEAGCARGCGAACPSPLVEAGFATCSDAGSCDFGCAAGVVLDGGCGCPAGQRVCADGACHACCGDGDCPNNTLCSAAHTCAGCAPAWGDCDGNPANGCETSLNSRDNCGQCGNSCCSGICGCGFLGFGSEKCRQQGASYSCGC